MNSSELPLLVVVLMVKNEASSIQDTLASYVTGGIKHFFILDTGSTDDTILLAQNFLKSYAVTVEIQQESFVDFAYSRNRALELAEARFSNAIFFLMPDAEWHLVGADALIRFCEREQHAETPLYLLTIKMSTTEFTTARLFRVSSHIRFNGVVHEVPSRIAVVKAPEPICFQVISTQQGIEKSKLRWEQDLILLTHVFEQNDQDPRTSFYLAQTYECLERLEEAYQLYQHRANLQGWDEETFITLFRLGCLAQRLSQRAGSLVVWETAMQYFLKAFSLKPHRIEPLVKMAEHYWPDNPQATYLYIKHAYDAPYPQQDLLFIEKQMYLYDRFELMSRCAWYVGEYRLGEEATLIALKYQPDAPHLQRNLELYQQKTTLIST